MTVDIQKIVPYLSIYSKTAFFSFLDFAIYEMVDSNTIWRSISLQKLVLEQEWKILTVVSDYLKTKKMHKYAVKKLPSKKIFSGST